MKKLLFLLTPALLLAWAVLPGSAEDKKPAASAETEPASEAGEQPPPKAKPAETKPAETKPAEPSRQRRRSRSSRFPTRTILASSATTPIQPTRGTRRTRTSTSIIFPLEALKNDVHWQKGVRCQDCHGGDATDA